MDGVLSPTQEQMQAIIRTAPFPIIATFDDTRIKVWNPAAEDVFGYSEQEALGMSIMQLVPDPEKEELQRMRLQAMAPGATIEAHVVRLHKDGTPIPVHLTLSPMVEAGQTIGLLGILKDLRPQREATESQATLEGILDIAPTGIMVIRPDGRILRSNPATEAMFGYGQGELAGKTLEDLGLSSKRRLSERIATASQEGQTIAEQPLTGQRKDGSPAHIGITIAPMQQAGEPRMVAILRDLSAENELRRLERQAVRIQHELQASRQMQALKVAFLNMASHELRTPITPIRLHLKTLLDRHAGPLTDKQERNLEAIARSMRRLSLLVEDIFTAAQLEQGAFGVARKETDLARLARQAIEEMAAEAQRADVRLQVDGASTLPVRGDPDRLTQLLINLVSNAIKYSPKGGTVEVRGSQGTGFVQVEVEDEGPGIPKSEVQRIFEPFHRLERDGSIPGTGLGLFICKGIAELHGGEIRYRPGDRGARFIVRLPTALDSAPATRHP